MIDLEEFLASSGIDTPVLERWIEREWLIVDRWRTGYYLTETDTARAILIHSLQGDLGVNDEGIDIVLHLIDQLHGLRQALANLQDALNEAGEKKR